MKMPTTTGKHAHTKSSDGQGVFPVNIWSKLRALRDGGRDGRRFILVFLIRCYRKPVGRDLRRRGFPESDGKDPTLRGFGKGTGRRASSRVMLSGTVNPAWSKNCSSPTQNPASSRLVMHRSAKCSNHTNRTTDESEQTKLVLPPLRREAIQKHSHNRSRAAGEPLDARAARDCKTSI